MTYVASPSYSRENAARSANLLQCLKTARSHLDETSRASAAEKDAELLSSAIAAGWEEYEVRPALETGNDGNAEISVAADRPTIGVVRSSSM